MSGLNFRPLTSQLGIGGTSYILQLGLINRKWAILLLKAKGLIASIVFNDLNEEDIPDANHIVNWIINTIRMPINSYQVWKTVQILLKQAYRRKVNENDKEEEICQCRFPIKNKGYCGLCGKKLREKKKNNALIYFSILTLLQIICFNIIMPIIIGGGF